MFSILDRLLFKETVKTLSLIVLVLTVIFVSNYMVRVLGKVAGGLFSSDVLLALVAFEYLKVIGVLIPPAFFFSLLWVLGRMHQGNEITALANAGVGTWGLFRAFLLSAVPMALIVFWLVFWVTPWAKSQTLEIRHQQKSEASIGALKPGRFNEFDQGRLTFFAEGAAADGSELHNVFVNFGDDGNPTLLVADRARIVQAEDGGRLAVLSAGLRYQGVPGEATYRVAEFEEYGIRLPTGDRFRNTRRSTRSWQALWQSDDLGDRAELQSRLVVPLSLFAFTLLAIPLSQSLPRRGIYGRLGIAIVMYFLFMNLLRLAERWMEDGATPAWLGMWWLPLVVVLVAVLLMAIYSNRFGRRIREVVPRWLLD